MEPKLITPLEGEHLGRSLLTKLLVVKLITAGVFWYQWYVN